MNNFMIAIQSVAPLFCMLLIGLWVKRQGILSDEELPHVNALVFRVFLPVMSFSSIYNTKLSDAINTKLIVFSISAVIAVYFGSLAFAFLIEKSNASRGAITQAFYRGNFAILGLPIIANIYGSDNLGMAAILLAFIVPLYNVLAVITFEALRGGTFHKKVILLSILKNPFILSAVLAILGITLQIQLPSILAKTVKDISAAAVPLAIVILGASFRMENVEHCRRNLIICTIGRLMVVPAICLTVAALLGFRNLEFVTLIALFCTPCATVSFAMAQQMDSDAELAGNCVIITSAVSCVTMLFWIFFFKQLGMF